MASISTTWPGYASTSTGMAVDAGALDHCVVGHCSAEPGHRRLLDVIGKRPLLDLDMRLGEGTGAAIALGLLRASIACHTGMATFEQARVDGPV